MILDSYARDDLLVNVAKLYYEFDYNQGMIAEKFSISRPFVSKLLNEAKERGIVTIQVQDPSRTESRMEKEIRQKYELRRVIVVPSKVGEDTLTRICVASGKYLNSIIKSGDIIAVGTGQTLNLSSKHLIRREDLSNLTVVQMEGAISNIQHSTYQQETTKAYADALGAVPYILPIPLFFSDVKSKELVYMEPCVQQVRKLQTQANIAIFNASNISTGKTMVFVRQGFITDAQMKAYIQKGAVANLLDHFLDINGEICDQELDARNTSVGLEMLRQKEYRICLAAGRAKIDSVTAVLNGRYANVLMIDESIAEAIIN